MSAQGKDGEDATPGLGPTDGNKPRLAVRVPGIGEHERTRHRKQNCFNLRKRNTVLLTFAPIAAIPFKSGNSEVREHRR